MCRNDYVFYDYETFSSSVKGAVSQFAAIRTDSRFRILEKTDIFCQCAQDTLIEPEACFITGITPVDTLSGMTEYEFAHYINELFLAKKNTYIVGYNNNFFDDEVTRNMLYRNGVDPYAWAWKGFNKRLDVLPLVRLVAALRPGVLVIPEVDDVDDSGRVVGKKVSFKLEHLSAANGIVHENAHNALSDVEALIAILDIISTKAPDLFTAYLNNSDKKAVTSFVQSNDTFGFSHFRFGRKSLYAAPARLMGEIKDGKYLSWDLRVSPEPYLASSDDELRAMLSMTRSERVEAGFPETHGFLTFKVNGLPALFDKELLTNEIRQKLGFDDGALAANEQMLADNDAFINRMTAIYRDTQYAPIPDDTDLNLYCSDNGGFFTQEESLWITEFRRASSWAERLAFWATLDECSRLKLIFFRVIGRNSPESFYGEFKEAWEMYVSARLCGLTLNAYTSVAELIEKLECPEFNKRWVVDQRADAVKISLMEYVASLHKQFNLTLESYTPPTFLKKGDPTLAPSFCAESL